MNRGSWCPKSRGKSIRFKDHHQARRADRIRIINDDWTTLRVGVETIATLSAESTSIEVIDRCVSGGAIHGKKKEDSE